MMGDDLDVLIGEIRTLAEDGVLVDPMQREQLFIQETDAQTDYEEGNNLYTYDDGDILNRDTMRPASDKTISEITDRVNRRLRNENRAADKMISKLNKMKGLRYE